MINFFLLFLLLLTGPASAFLENKVDVPLGEALVHVVDRLSVPPVSPLLHMSELQNACWLGGRGSGWRGRSSPWALSRLNGVPFAGTGSGSASSLGSGWSSWGSWGRGHPSWERWVGAFFKVKVVRAWKNTRHEFVHGDLRKFLVDVGDRGGRIKDGLDSSGYCLVGEGSSSTEDVLVGDHCS